VGTRTVFGRKALQLARLKSPEFRTRVAQLSGAFAMTAVSDCFEQSRDPYGVPWEPLKRRDGKPLVDTGALAASISAQPGEGSFKLVAPKKYAAIHQFGGRIAPHSRITPQTIWQNPETGRIVSRRTKLRLVYEHVSRARTYANGINIPARPYFPTKDRGLPTSWRRAVSEIVGREARRELGLTP
jgi:phage gpG-like protein